MQRRRNRVGLQHQSKFSRSASLLPALPLILFCLAAIVGLAGWNAMAPPETVSPIGKIRNLISPSEEPPGNASFKFGAASAAYQSQRRKYSGEAIMQIEGSVDKDGRKPSIWDIFSHTPGKVHNGDTGDVADDFYNRYEEDIAIMKGLGVQMFRFSLSWSRILPNGKGRVNKAGVKYYNQVIDSLVAAGIEPHITLYHWDLPQALEDEYGGWLSEKSVNHFAEYAEVAFKAFGKRVKHWTTFNEPWSFVFLGYDMGIHAPGRCSSRKQCSAGDSAKEPWIVTHNVLNAHASAVARFRKLQTGGKISINLNSDWSEPFSGSTADKEAAQRHIDFTLGIYADPIFKGEYPKAVRQRVKHLQEFTMEQRRLLLGSVDYFALNHYTSKYVRNSKDPLNVEGTEVLARKYGFLIGKQADSEWLHVVPWGLRKLLLYIQDRYNDPDIFITESGVDVPHESRLPLAKALKDSFRIDYFKGYLREAVKANKEHGVKLKGYFAWSILDNYEWADGYAKRFGIVYVDYTTLQRHVKDSAKWLSNYFAKSRAAASEQYPRKLMQDA